MGSFWSSLFGPTKKKPEKHPIKGGAGGRIKNLIFTHYRGILGFIILAITNCFTGSKAKPENTVICLWIVMFLFFLIQPVNIPVTGMMPVFYLVLFGILKSDVVCKCYYGSGQALFMLAGMVGMLLNNSKFDRRLMFMFMDPEKPVTPIGLLIKTSSAAFVLSILSNKLLVSSYMIEMLAPAFNDIEGGPSTDLKKFRNIIMNAIQTSASIGGMAIIHGSLTTLTMRIIYEEITAGYNMFSYFRYSAVLPLAITMFSLNLVYHVVLIKVQIKDNSIADQALIQDALSRGKEELPPKITPHEIQTIFFLGLALVLFFTRVTKFGGWQKLFNPLYPPDDMVTAAFIVIITSVLPKGCSFLKVLKAKKKSEMPPCKPESGIMFWKFVDKNTVYGYLFLIGGGNALAVAVNARLASKVADTVGKIITTGGYTFSLVIFVIITVILVNIMSGVAAVCVLLPLALSSYQTLGFMLGNTRAVLAVGLAGSLGFTFPFKFTCAYFVNKIGKVPKKQMAVLGAGSAGVCMVPLIGFITTCSWMF